MILSENVTFDDANNVMTAFGARISGSLLQYLAEPTPPGQWFRIVKVEDGVATVESRLETDIAASVTTP